MEVRGFLAWRAIATAAKRFFQGGPADQEFCRRPSRPRRAPHCFAPATWLATGFLLLASGCAKPVPPAPSEAPILESLPKQLSELGLFASPPAELKLAAGVEPYALNSPGYFDDADVQRVLRLPSGTSLTYRDAGPLEFPPGAVLAQTFAYPLDRRQPSAGRRLAETRVLLRQETNWVGATYLWNEQQSDAKLKIIGGQMPIEWLDEQGQTQSHIVSAPDANGCKRCHKPASRKMVPLGFTARQLHRPRDENSDGPTQLDDWAARGLLQGLPAGQSLPTLARWNQPTTGSLDERARAWLDVNCSHCHNPLGRARNSGLFLTLDIQRPAEFGVYKTPVAAGRGSGHFTYDIVPGKPEESILIHRLKSVEPGVVMPEYGRSRVDRAGVELMSAWIASLPPSLGTTPDQVGEVTQLSAEDLEQWSSGVDQHGDAARGEAIFHLAELNCLKCHALAGVGGGVGPDLTQWPTPPTRAHLIEAVLLPSKHVREGFATVALHLNDGRAVTGVKVQEDESQLVLRDPFQGDTRIALADIEERSVGGSLMPTGVVARLRKTELYDLLAFLAQITQQPPAAAQLDRGPRLWWSLTALPDEEAENQSQQLASWIDRVDPLAWRPTYARLSGVVPVEALAASAAGRVVECRFRADIAGALACELTAPRAAKVWLDGQPLAASEVATSQLEVGQHRLTLQLPAGDSAGEIKLAALDEATAAARVEWQRTALVAAPEQEGEAGPEASEP